MTTMLQSELDLALRAVTRAASVCQRVQANLVTAETLQKKDKSPVTVADFASQAVVCAALAEAFPDDPIVAEEAADELREDSEQATRHAVVRHVREALDDAQLEPDQVLEWIDRGNADGRAERFWALDPIDGTKGFLRGEQYAVALALIENGQVVLAALACPNMVFATEGDAHGAKGIVMSAVRGGGAYVRSLHDDSSTPGHLIQPRQRIAPDEARFCESVESSHSNQSASAAIAQRLGITAAPLRMDSQCKYAAVARGDAAIYLRLPTRADYIEKIWDHAAGSLLVEQAGGRVTDIRGKPLDFTHGRLLQANQGIIATRGVNHDEVVEAVAAK